MNIVTIGPSKPSMYEAIAARTIFPVAVIEELYDMCGDWDRVIDACEIAASSGTRPVILSERDMLAIEKVEQLLAIELADKHEAYADLKPEWDIVSRADVPLPKQAPRRRHMHRRLQRGRRA